MKVLGFGGGEHLNLIFTLERWMIDSTRLRFFASGLGPALQSTDVGRDASAWGQEEWNDEICERFLLPLTSMVRGAFLQMGEPLWRVQRNAVLES